MFNVPVQRIQRLPAGENRDKVEERLSQRIDSPTCYTPDRSSEGDSIFYSPLSSDNDMPKAPITKSKWSFVSYVAVLREIYYLFIAFSPSHWPFCYTCFACIRFLCQQNCWLNHNRIEIIQ